MTREERRDRVILFAAGLLDASEADEVRAFLRSGGEEAAACAAEARAILEDLAAGVPEAVPDPSLRERALAVASAPSAATPTRSAGAPVTAPAPGRGRLWLWMLAPAAAAAAAVAVWVAVPSGSDPAVVEALRAERNDALAEREALASEIETMDEELGDLEAKLRSLEVDLENASDQVAMLTGDDLEVMELVSANGRANASARMFWEWKEGYYCYLRAEGLAPTDDGEVYALWMETQDDRTLLVGSFEVSPSEEAAILWAKLPEDTGRAAAAFVTREPEEPGSEPRGETRLRSRS